MAELGLVASIITVASVATKLSKGLFGITDIVVEARIIATEITLLLKVSARSS
jgi:hypothetical protein